jgi:hypothetical protein
MAHELSEKFIDALNDLEANEKVENIVELFADNCKDGARDFWTNYRKTFGEMKSEFKNKITAENVSALEWTTTGTSAEGHAINYDGVSILEADGDQIVRFFAYFNPAKLGQQIMEETAKSKEA